MLPEEIVIDQEISRALKAFLDHHDYSKVAVLVDENTKIHCFPVIEDLIPDAVPVEIMSGEANKTLSTCETIWEKLTDSNFERGSLMINLGGGVIGDMGGFCAATFKRGIDFVNIPTTLLAQVDASVGGKLGIDFMGFKNHIGVFKKPEKVFIDTIFLDTLPGRELRSGFAEVIKHCLIADASYWSIVNSRNFEDQPWADLVRHSVEVKSGIVDQDPLEKGLRKILNFGHTIGHAVESFFLNNKDRRLLHGEAIAIGMICESRLSEKYCGLANTAVQSIDDYIIKTFGKITIHDDEIDRIALLCLQDKKNEKGTVLFSLLEEIGIPAYNVKVDLSDIKNALKTYSSS